MDSPQKPCYRAITHAPVNFYPLKPTVMVKRQRIEQKSAKPKTNF